MSPQKRTGDDGFTNLLGNERVAKHHLRPRSYGTVDESSAALGLARSLATSDETKVVIRAVQMDLYHMMAELAATKAAASRFREIDEARVAWLDREIEGLERKVEIQKDFVLVGDSPAAASLDLARAVVRRAERSVAQLFHEKEIDNEQILAYLNRLSHLCFVLMLWEDQMAGNEKPRRTKEQAP